MSDARQDRHRSGSRIANSLRTAGAKAKRMFFGASPEERRELRETDEPRKMKLGDLDMNALDRERFNAPKKVGETIDLIDIAMGKAPEIDPAHKPPPPPPSTGRPMIIPPRRPGDGPPEQGAPPPLVVAPPPRRWGEGALALLAVLAAALVFASRPALRELRPALAVEALHRRSLSVDPGAALDPWGQPWRARPGARVEGARPAPMLVYSSGPDGVDDRGAKDDLPATGSGDPDDLVTAAAWAPELALGTALLAAWLFVTARRARTASTSGCLGEAWVTLALAALPAALGAGAIAWLGGALTLPWPVPHGPHVESVRGAIDRAGDVRLAAGAWAGVVLAFVVVVRLVRRG